MAESDADRAERDGSMTRSPDPGLDVPTRCRCDPSRSRARSRRPGARADRHASLGLREVLRQQPRPARLHARGLPARDDLPDRQVGLRQEHAAALHQLPRGADDRRDRGRRAPGRRGPAQRPRPRAIASRSARSGCGAQMVFQEFNLFPHLKVIDNLIEAPVRVKGVSRDEAIATAEKYLDKVGLSREARRVPVAALGRPEAARGDRPGADDGAQGAPVRRADVRARPDARRRGAQRHGGPGPRGRDDDRRDPRDGVRPRGRGPRLLHRRGRVRRGRPARAGHRRPAGPADPRLPRPHARPGAHVHGGVRLDSAAAPSPSPPGRPPPDAPRIIGTWPRSPAPTSSTSPTSPGSA